MLSMNHSWLEWRPRASSGFSFEQCAFWISARLRVRLSSLQHVWFGVLEVPTTQIILLSNERFWKLTLRWSRAGSTALHMAASTTQPDIVKLLLQHNADVNALDQKGRSITYSRQRGYSISVRRLQYSHIEMGFYIGGSSFRLKALSFKFGTSSFKFGTIDSFEF